MGTMHRKSQHLTIFWSSLSLPSLLFSLLGVISVSSCCCYLHYFIAVFMVDFINYDIIVIIIAGIDGGHSGVQL